MRPSPPTPPSGARVLGLRCRGCGRPEADGPNYVCPACFGPLEVAYDLDVIRSLVTRDEIARRPAGHLALPRAPARSTHVPARGLAVGSTPLVAARAPRRGARRRRASCSRTTPGTRRSRSRTAPSRSRPPRPQAFGLEALACASTGNLAGATAAAAAAIGLPVLRLRPRGSRARQDRPRARVRRDGRPARRHLRRRQPRLPRGRRRARLGPRQRQPPPVLRRGQQDARLRDRGVARLAAARRHRRADRVGRDAREARPRVRGARRRSAGSSPRTVRFVGGQAAGCAPVATAFASGATRVDPVRAPDTIVRSLAIGNPADGAYALELIRATGGSIEAIPDADTADAIRRAARLEGLYTETAGGVTLGAVEAARRRGVIREGDEVVALLTGNGLKTPGRRPLRRRHPGRGARPARPRPGAPPALQRLRRMAVVMSQVRIPPVLRPSAGGQKLLDVPGDTVGAGARRARRRSTRTSGRGCSTTPATSTGSSTCS